jgi:uncharacterized membrane protein
MAEHARLQVYGMVQMEPLLFWFVVLHLLVVVLSRVKEAKKNSYCTS